jgi:AcrR family transcriptional regulator
LVVTDDSVPEPPPGQRKPAKVDGRRLRSERTRRLIVEAYMALVRETRQVPTAAQIAERAGYSVRSIFERFPDLQALRLAATDYAIAEGRAQGALRDLDADRATRMRSQVESRGQGCERWLPLWRVLSTSLNESSELRERIRLVRQLVAMRLEFMFKPELSTLSDDERRKTLVALEAITDYESWGRMREMYGLSFEDACAVWIRAIDGLLPPTPTIA